MGIIVTKSRAEGNFGAGVLSGIRGVVRRESEQRNCGEPHHRKRGDARRGKDRLMSNRGVGQEFDAGSLGWKRDITLAIDLIAIAQ